MRKRNTICISMTPATLAEVEARVNNPNTGRSGVIDSDLSTFYALCQRAQHNMRRYFTEGEIERIRLAFQGRETDISLLPYLHSEYYNRTRDDRLADQIAKLGLLERFALVNLPYREGTPQ